MTALEVLGKLDTRASYTQVAIACIQEDAAGQYQVLAGALRHGGIPCEVLLEPGKLTKQAILAEKKCARWLVIPGADPLQDPLTLRDLNNRTNQEGLSLDQLIARLH